MKNRKQTSPALTRLAAKTLANPKASQRSKSLAGWALSQAGDQARMRNRAATQPDAARALQELRGAVQTREQPPASATTMTSLPFVAALVLVVGTLAALPEIIGIDRNWWHSRFLVPLTFAGLVVWLLVEHRPPARLTIFAAATTAASFVLLALLPERATDSPNVLARMSAP